MSNFISSDHIDQPILRYDLLFEEGLKLAQQYAGKIWTDYNYHDPGVTFLEYFCYALTDLGYRTSFSIPDLFLFETDDFDTVNQNLFFGPADVFNSTPSTINDYRKLIIDQIKQVANAWVIPITDNKMGISGLFEIFIESGEDLNDLELKYLKRQVAAVFHSHRLIGHDLADIYILRKVNLSIKGDITLESDALGELVMAKIYSILDSYINPQVELHDPIKLWKERGFKPEEVLTGPLPKFGFIFEHELTPKVEIIYLSRIKELILEVEGVREIKSLQLFKNELPVFDNFVHFDKTEFPKIQYLDELTESFKTEIRLLKNNLSYEVDPAITKQLIAAEVLSGNKFYHEELRYEQKLPKGRFEHSDLQKHIPIHLELPEFFGLGKYGISDNATKESLASVRQLGAYLYFFEQMMASYLAQLANLRRLFSVNTSTITYFNQVPVEIPQLDQLIGDFKNLQINLDDSSKLKDDYTDRRNRLLNHLLARFGESIDEGSLKKMRSGNALESAEQIEISLIQTKVNLLNEIVTLGKNKAKAFDQKAEKVWDTANISGLEMRIALALNFKDFTRRYLSAPLLNYFDLSSTKNIVGPWEFVTIATEKSTIQAVKLPSDNYANQAVHFYGVGLKFVRELFELAANEKSISYLISADRSRHFLLMQQRESDYPFVVYEAETAQECLEVKLKIMNQFATLDQESEGFHMIEHLLLRPLEPVSFLFCFRDLEGEIIIEGMYPGEMKDQKSLGEDLVFYGVEVANYTITELENEPVYQVLIYNPEHEPIAKLVGEFNSKVGAKQVIDSTLTYFEKLRDKEIDLDSVLDINHSGGTGYGFPADFQYSDTLTFLFPDWPNRFQKADFVNFIRNQIAENSMAHHAVNLYFLNLTELAYFEDVYHQWLQQKNEDNSDLKKVDLLSLQLIQFLGGLESAS